MIKQVILFLFAITPILLFGQVTKKVTIKYKNSRFKEVYYVLKSNKTIRHGSYQKLGYKDAVRIQGYYKNGQKDSIWTEYNRDGINKKSQGFYSKDEKINVWEFYDFKGVLEQKYDFTKNEILYYQLDEKGKILEHKIINGFDTIIVKLDRPTLYIGGSSNMLVPVSNNIKYPKMAKEKGVSGSVYISFTVDNTGKAINHKVFKGIGSGCDEEALRVVRKIPNNWLPALLNGHPISQDFVIPIRFSLM